MSAASALTLTGGKVVTPDGVLESGRVCVRDGLISEVDAQTAQTAQLNDGQVVDVRGQWVVPGFVDIHCHGGGGSSFTSLNPDELRRAITAHRRRGTTTMLASLVSAQVADLVKQIGALDELVTSGELAGIHLEGPFLSAGRCGAHDPAMLCPPLPHLVDALLSAGPDSIRMVTLAPELEHAITAIRTLADHGVIPAIGHTDAVFSQVAPALDAGARVATHLFNGMRPLHHREPGPIGALLADERVAVELICDLVHVHPAVLRLAAEHAGNGRTVLVTDAISAASAGDGEYELGRLPVTVHDGVATLADGSLAGSTLTMDVAFRNLVSACGLPVSQAVAAAATTPAALLGMSDRVGAIRPGLSADLVILDRDLRPVRVMKGGAWVPGVPDGYSQRT